MKVRINRYFVGVIVAGASVIGCSGRPSLVPNSDPGLRKTASQFSADAAKRKYPADAPRGGESIGRAQVGYTMNTIEIVNLSDEDWNNVEIWANEQYVVFVPKIEPHKSRTINFQMLYNDKGEYFPLDNSKVIVKKLEVLKDGKVYDIPVHVAL
jgi:hypothetical protein